MRVGVVFQQDLFEYHGAQVSNGTNGPITRFIEFDDCSEVIAKETKISCRKNGVDTEGDGRASRMDSRHILFTVPFLDTLGTVVERIAAGDRF